MLLREASQNCGAFMIVIKESANKWFRVEFELIIDISIYVLCD